MTTVLVEITDEELEQMVLLLQNPIVKRRIKASPLRRIADILVDASLQIQIDPQDREYLLTDNPPVRPHQWKRRE